MNISIAYCVAWNFLPQASRLEAEMKAKYPDATITLIQGGSGIFDVMCNGTLIYSKQHSEGQRFPHEGEITRLIKQEADS